MKHPVKHTQFAKNLPTNAFVGLRVHYILSRCERHLPWNAKTKFIQINFKVAVWRSNFCSFATDSSPNSEWLFQRIQRIVPNSDILLIVKNLFFSVIFLHLSFYIQFMARFAVIWIEVSFKNANFFLVCLFVVIECCANVFWNFCFFEFQVYFESWSSKRQTWQIFDGLQIFP